MTPDEINAQPDRVRDYIRDLETNADPAGTIQENALLKDQTRELDAMIANLKIEVVKGKHPREQYNRLADFVIPKKHMWKGHDGSHVDSVIREIERLEEVCVDRFDLVRKLVAEIRRLKKGYGLGPEKLPDGVVEHVAEQLAIDLEEDALQSLIRGEAHGSRVRHVTEHGTWDCGCPVDAEDVCVSVTCPRK